MAIQESDALAPFEARRIQPREIGVTERGQVSIIVLPMIGNETPPATIETVPAATIGSPASDGEGYRN